MVRVLLLALWVASLPITVTFTALPLAARRGSGSTFPASCVPNAGHDCGAGSCRPITPRMMAIKDTNGGKSATNGKVAWKKLTESVIRASTLMVLVLGLLPLLSLVSRTTSPRAQYTGARAASTLPLALPLTLSLPLR